MNLLKNKQGIGIAYVLGIVTFVLALTTTLFAVTINQAVSIKKSSENVELYANHAHQLTSASLIIQDDPTILDDLQKRTALATLLDITIVQPSGQSYWVLTNNDPQMSLTSYLQYIPPGSGGFIEFDGLLISKEDFDKLVLGLYSIPRDFHIQAASAFYNEFFLNISGINPATNSFQSIRDHVNAAHADGFQKIQYITGNYAIQNNTVISTREIIVVTGNLTIGRDTVIPTNQIFVVFGSMTINNHFNGIAIVNGNVTITGNAGTERRFSGSVYAGGAFLGSRRTFYAYSRNSFIFADSFTSGSPQSRTVSPNSLYSFSNSLNINSNNLFTGGFFTEPDGANAKMQTEFRHISNPLTLADGVPLNLIIEIAGEGGDFGSGQIISTSPR